MITTSTSLITPFTSPTSYLSDREIVTLKQFATRDALKQRPSHDLPVRLGISGTDTFNDLQRDVAALITYYLARRLPFSIEQDLVNYSLTLSRRVVLPGIIAVWLDILKAEICATKTSEYEALCSQAQNRLRQVTPANTFSDYAARYTLKGNDQLKDFDDWFDRFENVKPGGKHPTPIYTFRHRIRIRKEQQAVARENKAKRKPGRPVDTSIYWEWMQPYETYQEFARANRPRFIAVYTNAPHFLEQKFGIKFSREYIFDRAQYCKHPREFSLNNTGLMFVAKRLGCYDELMQVLQPVKDKKFLLDAETKPLVTPDGQIDVDTLIEQVNDETPNPQGRPAKHWTLEELEALSKEIGGSMVQLTTKHHSARRFMQENCPATLSRLFPRKRKQYTVESMTEAIQKYSSKKELRRENSTLYEVARAWNRKGKIDLDNCFRRDRK
ncbi:hypothetical protein [Shewanella algae]|uniref:hypothetical protein n=1 Tax=Shewanella algae TaxID=38313 RepID=UPI001AAD994E|nr:hypothetical protein [Shewanella algae]MBO2699905.1 hypothetical protein [Shewanella algae]